MPDKDGPRDDSAFKPDPPRKIGYLQVLLLFVYHIALALLLAYAIYNVWPPQPWPGDTAEVKAEKAKAEAEEKKAAANTNSATQNQNSSNAAIVNANANSRTVNTNTAGNANASRPASLSSNAVAAGNGANANAAASPIPESTANAGEATTSVYGSERPPPFWLFGRKFQPTLEVRLLLLVLLAGAIGSYIHASSSFVDYLGNRTLISSWVWWYLLRPFIGMMLALLFYFVFRGGFITAGVNSGGEGAASYINPFGIAALGGLVGMFSKIATDKLNEVFLTLFTPKAGQGDAKRGDKLSGASGSLLSAISPTVGPTTGGTAVTIIGTDFLDVMGVNFGGVPATAIVVKDPSTLTAATPAHAAGAVDVEVIYPSQLKADLKGGFTYTDDANAGVPANSAAGGEAGAAGDAAADELDVHDLDLKPDTPDEDLPITEGGVG
jgi:hypothetical protein